MNAIRTVGTALLGAGLLSCGTDAPSPAADPWPLVLEDTTVLGYAVVCLPPATRDALLQEAFGWKPAGLEDARPLGMVRFDSDTFGGPAGLLVPVQDGPDFLASLEVCPGIEVLGGNRYAFRPPLQSWIGMLLLAASGWELSSPMEMLASIGELSQLEFPLQVRIEGDHALVVPSFEALAVCRDFLQEVRGFEHARPAEAMLSMDLAQLRIVYAEQIRRADQQLRALASGASLAGPIAMLGTGAWRPDEEPGLSINWDLVAAVRAMLDLDHVDALQMHASASEDPEGRREETLEALLGSLSSVRLRVLLAEGSRLRPVLETLRPAPRDADALLLLRADPDRFAPAFAAWCRPLAEFAKGVGAPAERHVVRLAELLSAWDGLLGVVEPPGPPGAYAILATVRGDGIGLAALAEWLEPLLRSAGAEDVPSGGRVEELADGRRCFRDAAGDIVLTTGRAGPVQWWVAGDGAAPASETLIRFAQVRDVAEGPALRARVREARVELRQLGGETLVDLAFPGAN